MATQRNYGLWGDNFVAFIFLIKNLFNERCLASSVSTASNSWSEGCNLKPHTGFKDYLKIKLN